MNPPQSCSSLDTEYVGHDPLFWFVSVSTRGGKHPGHAFACDVRVAVTVPAVMGGSQSHVHGPDDELLDDLLELLDCDDELLLLLDDELLLLLDDELLLLLDDELLLELDDGQQNWKHPNSGGHGRPIRRASIRS